MHGQTGRVRLPTMSASPKWSKWLWLTSSTSHRSTVSAAFGLVGFENHGSMTIVLPPGVRTSQHEWPYHVNDVSRSSPTRHLLVVVVAAIVGGSGSTARGSTAPGSTAPGSIAPHRG